VKPPPFDYRAPDSIDEVLAALTEHGSDAKLLAGGQSLIPLLNFRLVRPGLLVDLRRLPSMADVNVDEDAVEIGAMVRQRTIEHDPVLAHEVPLLVEATRYIGHLPIRTRGTIGGSLAHADPVAEYPLTAVALDAELVVRGPAGERRLPARDFFLAYLTTALDVEDVLVSIRLPRRRPGVGSAFVEFARRPGDFAILAVAAVLDLDADDRVSSAAVAIAGGGPVPFRASAAEQVLVGNRLDATTVRSAAAAAAEAGSPESDLQATADYRRRLSSVLVARAVEQAAGRARLAA
jgi:aerobic carbon-monoxide dehydrogenase medium subunit